MVITQTVLYKTVVNYLSAGYNKCNVCTRASQNPAYKKEWVADSDTQIVVFPQPVGLRGKVPVQDIAFLILETPRYHDEDIAFADPCALLDLSLDPAHPFHAVEAPDPDMVCPHHQFGAGKLLAVSFLGKPYTYYRGAVRIELRCAVRFSRFLSAVLNADISRRVLYGTKGDEDLYCNRRTLFFRFPRVSRANVLPPCTVSGTR